VSRITTTGGLRDVRFDCAETGPDTTNEKASERSAMDLYIEFIFPT
jgi:hypothetical protein